MPDQTPPASIVPTPGKPSGFRSLLGYYADVWRDGYAELVQPLEAKHMNSMGLVHGGLYVTLLDAVLGHACTWCPVKGNARFCVTVSLTTSFLASTDKGILRAVGRLESIEDRMAVCRGEIVDEAGQILAIAQGSFRYVNGGERPDGVPRKRRVDV